MTENQEHWIKDHWDEPKGRTLCVKIKDHLHSVRTDFQQIDVYETECFGRALVLDGVINVTEFDEFAYHEMIVHVPLHTHPAPRRVLIIGGGDGGSIREALKHPTVEEVHLCEIDREVIEACKQYMPSVAVGFDDKRVSVFCRDGAEFVKERKGYYDVIIVDSSDPWGPATVLFQQAFYQDMAGCLNDTGLIATQSESMFFDRSTIHTLLAFGQEIFAIGRYYYTLVPTYPSGTIGFFLGSKKSDPLQPRLCHIEGLRYYNTAVHRTAFSLPPFVMQPVKS
jgi:spermidine synthase